MLAAGLFDDPLTKWTVIIAAILTIFYAVMRPKFRRKDPLDLSQKPAGHLAQQRQVEREMSNVLVELSDMARQITAQLDSRAAKLEALIEEADRRIAQLQSPHDARSAPSSPAPPPPRPSRPPPDERYQSIYDLADQGMDIRQIAQQLGQPRGEIELILALRERAGSES